MTQIERFQEEARPDTKLGFRVFGCDTLTPYERRALYQVEGLACGRAYSLKRILSSRSPTCRFEFKFHRGNGDAASNVAHAIEHLIVSTAEELRNPVNHDGSLSGVTLRDKDNPPIIILYSNAGGAEKIFLRAVEIITGAVNERLLVKKSPERKISFSAI